MSFQTFALKCVGKRPGSIILAASMGNKSATSCLSAEAHDIIKDPLIHYFGCVQFCDRDKLLEDPEHPNLDERDNAPNKIREGT